MQALIVDDDIATVDVVENSIDWKSLGVTEIFTAYNISRAKEILSERNVDIIISDIEMPKGSGIDLLEWIRENEIPGEFLFLTCYEKFDYAAKALKNHASEYLLKPFDINVMEVALKKIVLKLKERQQLIAESEYGKWAKRNSRQMKLAFWNQMISGHLTGRGAAESIAEKQLNIDAGASYRLVISKIARPDQEKMNQGLMLFIIENIHSEILCGNPENECILSYPEGDCYVITTIYKVHASYDVNRQCRELRRDIQNMFGTEITICISREIVLEQLYETYKKNKKILEENVGYCGMIFHEEDVRERKMLQNLFNPEQIESLLETKQKMRFLSYLKSCISDGDCGRKLKAEELKRGKEEILQAIYAYFGKKGIRTTPLFSNEDLRELEKNTSRSAADLMRWASFLMDCVIEYEEEVKRQYTLSEQIDRYIIEHYHEDIGRNEVARQFHLSAEYIAKIYKQETGKSLKDFITECRINEAKKLLERGNRVSEVATTVGFDNFTYFSTVFKKMTGMTPNEYRRISCF